MNNWLTVLHRTLEREAAMVRVTVASIKGSAPREPGACMLVGPREFHGSIGGGHLELKAIEIARHMLQQPSGAPSRLDRFALGATLGQCCGGAVNLWFDRYDPSDGPFLEAVIEARLRGPTVIATAMDRHGPARRALLCAQPAGIFTYGACCRGELRTAAENLLHAPLGGPWVALLPANGDRAPVLLERANSRHAQLWLFGAGHVGRALTGVFADLPFDIVWVDSRPDAFPREAPANVTMRLSDSPVDEVARAPAGAWFLVMTHSHDLDYALCAAILRRDDYTWAGLIGSETKATCFSVRYAREGFPAQAIARLTSPIGTRSIRSKLPGAIAVSIAGQLLERLEAEGAQAQDHANERTGASIS